MTARTIGLTLAGIAGAYACFNAVRAGLDPAAFAIAFGAPLASQADASFVHVYAIRSLFMGGLALALLVAGQVRALALFAAVAVIVPIADAAIAAAAGASALRIGLHLAIAGVLALTGALLWLASRAKAT